MVSIIIPVYNSEKFLKECLTSVQKQTYTDIEVLCIDDGSTDMSGEIIRKFALSDNRFVYIKKNIPMEEKQEMLALHWQKATISCS